MLLVKRSATFVKSVAFQVHKSRNLTTSLRLASSFNDKQVTPVCVRAEQFRSSVAVADQYGEHTYGKLLNHSNALAKKLVDICGRKQSLSDQDRVAYLCSNDASYVVTQWATWLSGNVAVPLHKSHPIPQLEYYIDDSQSAVIVTTEEFVNKVEPIATKRKLPLVVLNSDLTSTKEPTESSSQTTNEFFNTTNALILYTSGTTGPPKGVVLTHANLHAQVKVIVEAMQLSAKDSALHILPLHHTHGIVHALLSPLHVGARCVILPQFDPAEVWKALISPKNVPERVNVIFAVPTMYVKLVDEYRRQYGDEELHTNVKEICQQKMRLMICGSSALPEPIFSVWKRMTGHRILERYGSTEIGLALTNPVDGKRRAGFVGTPLSSIEVCVAKENPSSPNGYDIIASSIGKETTVTPGKDGQAGELLVRGPSVFKEYWNKPEATKKTFTSDGWFKTGDTVSFHSDSYKIEGRTSVDIIKSGGYKISALDVERYLMSHPDIADVVVVGVADPTWGQRVAAVVVTKSDATLELSPLREWCKERMAPYIIPSLLKVMKSIPKNAVGKVNKKELVKELFPENKA